MTCRIVKAPTDIPRIMESPRCWRARSQRFDLETEERRGACVGLALPTERGDDAQLAFLRQRAREGELAGEVVYRNQVRPDGVHGKNDEEEHSHISFGGPLPQPPASKHDVPRAFAGP